MTMGRSYKEVAKWLKELPKWKQRVESLKMRLSHIPGLTQQLELVNIHGEGAVSQSVLNVVLKRLWIQQEELPFWELRVTIMVEAIQALTAEDQELLELKYMRRFSREQLVERYHTAISVLYRRQEEILKLIYDSVGGDRSTIWVEYKEPE